MNDDFGETFEPAGCREGLVWLLASWLLVAGVIALIVYIFWN